MSIEELLHAPGFDPGYLGYFESSPDASLSGGACSSWRSRSTRRPSSWRAGARTDHSAVPWGTPSESCGI